MSSNEATNVTATHLKGFAEGVHVVLRPVQEADLGALAQLMANNPGEPERLPWTEQRLRKKFDDEKEPGLWGKSTRIFAALRKDSGEVIGYLKERRDENPGVVWAHLHIADHAADRDVLGPDVLAAFLAFKLRWHDPLRISFDVLGCEADKARWLEQSGFPLEVRRERMVLWLGQPQAICTHAWYSERLKAELAKRDL